MKSRNFLVWQKTNATNSQKDVTTSSPFSLVCLRHSLCISLSFFLFFPLLCLTFLIPFLFSFLFSTHRLSSSHSLPLCVFISAPPSFFLLFFLYRAPSLVYLSTSQQQTNFEFPSKMLSILQNRLLKIGMNLGLKLGKVLATNIFLLDLWEKIKAWKIQFNLPRQQYTMKTWSYFAWESIMIRIWRRRLHEIFPLICSWFCHVILSSAKKVLRLPYVPGPISILGSVGKWKFLCIRMK